MRKFKKQKGLTLVEVISAVVILGFVFLIGANVLSIGTTAVPKSSREFDLQSGMRTTAETVANKTRYSTAVFILPESSFNAANIARGLLDEKWNYLGVLDAQLDDGTPAKEIVSYVYDADSGRHNKTVLVPAMADFTYDLVFSQPDIENNLVNFELSATNPQTGQILWNMDSEVEALNSLQVIDRSTAADVGRALVYRSDDRPMSVIGRVTMILDTSGSMAYSMSGQTSGVPVASQRITILKQAATQLITEFGADERIELCVIPFDSSANIPSNFRSIYTDGEYTFANVSENLTMLRSLITNLVADGGTNTGDGMRRAYYTIDDAPRERDTEYKDYLILLVDGDTTYATVEPTPSPSTAYNITYYTAPGELGAGLKLEARFQQNTVYARGTQVRSTPYGNARVSTFQSPWSYYSTNYHLSVLAGNGNPPQTNVIDYHSYEYTKMMGQNLLDLKVKPYVVALSNSVSTSGIINLQEALGVTEAQGNLFRATDSARLQSSFTAIKNSIIRDLWFIEGPRLQPEGG